MRDLVSITKALADANRVRILCALEGGELCVCQIQELLGLAASTTSKHLAILTRAGLVDFRKEGRWAHYRLTAGEATEEAEEALAWIARHAPRRREILEDRRRLVEILKLSPEELCQRQAKGLRCCSSAPATRAAAR